MKKKGILNVLFESVNFKNAFGCSIMQHFTFDSIQIYISKTTNA